MQSVSCWQKKILSSRCVGRSVDRAIEHASGCVVNVELSVRGHGMQTDAPGSMHTSTPHRTVKKQTLRTT
jgi:hypothetical protein